MFDKKIDKIVEQQRDIIWLLNKLLEYEELLLKLPDWYETYIQGEKGLTTRIKEKIEVLQNEYASLVGNAT